MTAQMDVPFLHHHHPYSFLPSLSSSPQFLLLPRTHRASSSSSSSSSGLLSGLLANGPAFDHSGRLGPTRAGGRRSSNWPIRWSPVGGQRCPGDAGQRRFVVIQSGGVWKVKSKSGPLGFRDWETGSVCQRDQAMTQGWWRTVVECGGRLRPSRLVGGLTGVVGSALRRALALAARGDGVWWEKMMAAAEGEKREGNWGDLAGWAQGRKREKWAGV
ncbi:hypothetical protein Droror1_Dr00002492 [Drosera rotundifolia]